MSMIELIIALAVGAVVALLAVFVLRATVQTQGAVTSSTRAATQGQDVSDLIDAAVRPATGLQVSTAGDRLDVRRPDACESFQVSGGELYRKVATGPTGAIDSTWSKLLTWGQSASLTVVPVPDPTTGVGKPYFQSLRSSTGVAYNLRLTVSNASLGGSDQRVDIASTVMQRALSGGGPACF